VIDPFNAYDGYKDRAYAMNVVVAHRSGNNPLFRGNFCSYVCLRCGRTEWYATHPVLLEQVAAAEPNMRVIEVPTPPHPYR